MTPPMTRRFTQTLVWFTMPAQPPVLGSAGALGTTPSGPGDREYNHHLPQPGHRRGESKEAPIAAITAEGQSKTADGPFQKPARRPAEGVGLASGARCTRDEFKKFWGEFVGNHLVLKNTKDSQKIPQFTSKICTARIVFCTGCTGWVMGLSAKTKINWNWYSYQCFTGS
jgi:hypothetical protein